MRKPITKTKAKAKAWKVFSEYVRRSHQAPIGYVVCYTCGAENHWKKLQAGHGISGRNNAVLFMEEVVRPQCVGCNVFGRGKQAVFTRKLIEELGMKEYDRLVQLSNTIVQYKVQDYLEIEEKYKQKVAKLT